MALTATGLGSGLNITEIVKVLVDAEKVPKEAIFNKTEDTIDAKVSAIGTLKSQLSKFQDALKKLQDGGALNQRTVTLGNEDFFTATAGKNSLPGSYNIKIEALAQQHKVAGAATADASAAVGEGSLQFAINGENFSVDVEATDSLEDIAKKVNANADNSGVTATVITSDAGSRLVFSSDKEGTDNQISVTATDTSGTGLSGMFGAGNLEEIQAASNAVLYIDGQKLTSQSNEVKDAIPGVTLNLTDADVNKTTKLTIAQDTDAVKENVKGFVDAYNSLITSIEKLSAYDVDKKEAAALQGDSMIRSLESQLRSGISDRVATADGTIALYDIGIKTDRYGKLSIDDAKLDEAIKTNMDGVEALFSTKDTGLANAMDELATTYVKAGGVIDTRNQAYTGDKQRLADQREAFALKMELLEARLTKQFNAMDLVVGQLSAQGQNVIGALNSLPGVVKKSS
ncbi:flagellar filament capping protein FliD [Shewanella algae]|uniref:flagellar filament capping protein FliD n=1 Tax=Shewanella algae TaxID=38313 RepID=UPI001AAC995B|nr:flagellar filament capping protein FliD [Shewanella algae]MBO2602857.1 flagellar filament capping protein FliD [Shewanella algae]